MKKLYLILLILAVIVQMDAKEKETLVLIKTDLGNIKLKLYNETPLHRDNFVKVTKDGVYKDLLFHRVIKDFMIQGGDPESKNAADSALLGNGDLGYTVPAEFRAPQLFHKKGALAAARTADNVNPEKASSACQFYIVTGRVFAEAELQQLEKQRFERLKQAVFNELQSAHMSVIKDLYATGNREALAELRSELQTEAEATAEARRNEALFTPEQREVYTTVGGTPHLDGGYTVFGEVVEGIDVLDKIQNMETDRNDRPKQNIKMTVSIVK
ncbi:peptidylprolyl isomerase [Dysgonomonas sp. PH5-45]|uniref:peptidylprolyl isomerase n=1 Tax=unclassified Dysgonomonas TaxID=2630389 RepID=UPI002473E8BE|nr:MULTISPECIES: peptidylprolyl isomerase [unclassified Dysgonomonas]MDH6355519.1 peptidylprolyl isomerase [Dysgonomonas sp. PH5-45]MDH6388420.1 peptidylprolyl isomerase [Dysgonomonas sp. PH5-37]